MNVTVKSYQKERESEIKDGLRRSLGKVGLIVEREAKNNVSRSGDNHPQIQTGRLRSSIGYKVEGDTVIIGTSVEYGKYLEFGHRQTPGRYVAKIGKRLKKSSVPPYPWLFPAIESKRGEIKDAFLGRSFIID